MSLGAAPLSFVQISAGLFAIFVEHLTILSTKRPNRRELCAAGGVLDGETRWAPVLSLATVKEGRAKGGNGRVPLMDGHAISFGPFRLLAAQRLLLEGDKPVRLGSRAFDIL